MFSNTLNLWGNGSVTLPKEWRERFPTKHFMATETPDGYLVIKPILDAVYYENEEGFGINFPMGIPADELAKNLRKSHKSMKR